MAQKVLDGENSILEAAIKYVCYELDNDKSKNVRAGAAKILEKVAEKKPELIANDLKKLKPALKVKEPQTRWMLLQVFGFCAQLNPRTSSSVVDTAKSYLNENAGVCLSGAVHLYLGRIGAISKKNAELVFPILDDAISNASENEIDWILEAFISIINNADSDAKEIIKRNAELQLDAKKKSTQKRAMKIIKMIQKD